MGCAAARFFNERDSSMDDSRYNVFQTDDGFWCIEQTFVRSFLFVGEREALLVDCLLDGDLKARCENITDKPIRVVITHADGDHTLRSSTDILSRIKRPLRLPRCGKGT